MASPRFEKSRTFFAAIKNTSSGQATVMPRRVHRKTRRRPSYRWFRQFRGDFIVWEADQDHAAKSRIIPTPQTANKASQGQKLEKSSSFDPFQTISARVLHGRPGKWAPAGV